MVVCVWCHVYLFECVLLYVIVCDVVLRELSALFVCGYGMSDCVGDVSGLLCGVAL